MDWRDKVKMRIEQLGMSQRAIEKKAGFHRGRISLWIKDEPQGEPGISDMLALSRALGVPMEYLADDDQDRPHIAVELEPEIQAIVQITRVLGAEEAMRRLTLAGPGQVGPGGKPDQQVGREPLPGNPDTSRNRLGFEREGRIEMASQKAK